MYKNILLKIHTGGDSQNTLRQAYDRICDGTALTAVHQLKEASQLSEVIVRTLDLRSSQDVLSIPTTFQLCYRRTAKT